MTRSNGAPGRSKRAMPRPKLVRSDTQLSAREDGIGAVKARLVRKCLGEILKTLSSDSFRACFGRYTSRTR